MNKKAYIYQYEEWPNFIWDINKISDLLADVRNKQGRLIGKMEVLGFDLQNEAFLESMWPLVQEIVRIIFSISPR